MYRISVRFGAFLQLVPRGTQVLELDPPAPPVEHLDPRRVQRVVEQPALRVGERAGRQRLVDLLDGEEAAADASGEQGFAGLVRATDLQRRHSRFPSIGGFKRSRAARAPL